MLNTLDLITNGFRKSEGVASSMKSGTVALYQKRVRNGEGETLYFINVWQWDFSGQLPADVEPRYRFSSEVRFYVNDHVSFDINLHPDTDTTVSTVNTFYADAYRNMGCCPDLHNN